MRCQSCKKARATVHLTDISDAGEPVEHHLCDKCAMKEGVKVQQHQTTAAIIQEFLKQGLSLQKLVDRVCPKCGMTIKDFQEQGLLGCPYDYTAFGDILKPIIARAHEGATHHVGKKPKEAGESAGRNARLLRLNRDLREAVDSEEYELAAQLRDDIQSLHSAE